MDHVFDVLDDLGGRVDGFSISLGRLSDGFRSARIADTMRWITCFLGNPDGLRVIPG